MEKLLEVKDCPLKLWRGEAVRGKFYVNKGETVFSRESGCGKSVTVSSIMQLYLCHLHFIRGRNTI